MKKLVLILILLLSIKSFSQNQKTKDYSIFIDNKEVNTIKPGDKFELRINIIGSVYSKKYKVKLDIPDDIIFISGKRVSVYSRSKNEIVYRLFLPKNFKQKNLCFKYKKKNIFGLGVWIWRFTLKYPILIVGTIITVPIDVFNGFTILPDLMPAYGFHGQKVKKTICIPVSK